MEAFVDGGEEFPGKSKPGFAGEDGIRSVERRGESLANAAEAMEGDAGEVGVGDAVVVEGLRNNDGRGANVSREVGAEVLEGEQVGGEPGVGKGKVVVQDLDVAHDEGMKRRGQCGRQRD